MQQKCQKNYKLCDQLSDEIAELNKSKRLLEVELGILQKKEKDHKSTTNVVVRGRVTAIAVMQHQVLLQRQEVLLPIPQLGQDCLEYQVLPFLLVHLVHQSLLPYNLQFGQGPFQILT